MKISVYLLTDIKDIKSIEPHPSISVEQLTIPDFYSRSKEFDFDTCLFVLDERAYESLFAFTPDVLQNRWIFIVTEDHIPYTVYKSEPIGIYTMDDFIILKDRWIVDYQSILAQRLVERNKSNALHLQLTNGKSLYCTEEDVVYVMADGDISHVFLLSEDGSGEIKKVTVNQSLKTLKSNLSEFSFFRIHKSYIVNLGKVAPFGDYPGQQISILNSDISLPLAKRRKLDFAIAYRATK